jgi:hypothetical protein
MTIFLPTYTTKETSQTSVEDDTGFFSFEDASYEPP